MYIMTDCPSSHRLQREERLVQEVEERRRREEEARFMAEQQRLQEEKEAQERARAEQEENLRLQRQVSNALWVIGTIYHKHLKFWRILKSFC